MRHSLDFGPIYFETDPLRFPVEPWNTASNLIFLAISIYFLIKLRKSRAQLEVLKFAVPMMLLGFIGGTVFHATRSHWVWLLLDFMPIMILSLAASLHFLNQLFKRPLLSLGVVFGAFLGVRLIRKLVPMPLHLRISFGYTMLAALILLPAILYCRSKNWRRIHHLFGAILSFGLAIYFRIVDTQGLLPMGTHFLWHLFGGISAFLMMNYIYLEGEEGVNTPGT